MFYIGKYSNKTNMIYKQFNVDNSGPHMPVLHKN